MNIDKPVNISPKLPIIVRIPLVLISNNDDLPIFITCISLINN